MNTKSVNSAAGVILAALTQNRTAAGIAMALDSAQLLMTPETAAEHEKLRTQFAEAAATVADLVLKRGERMKVENALRDEVEELRARVTELEVAALEGRAALAALCHDLDDPGSMALGALYLLQQATPGTPMEPGETVPTMYRASHDSIVMGLYTTAASAREHCEAEERRSWAKAESPVFDWIEDEEDGVAELTAWVGGEERTTGYVVTALEVASEYDEETDE